MNRRRGAVCGLVALALCLASGALAKPAGVEADLVLRGGAIYTVDAARSWAEAVAIERGKLVYVGSDAGAQRYVGAKTRVVDLEGKLVLPGLVDSHVHPVDGGIELAQCQLSGARTRDEVFETVARCAARDPDAAWIRGGGWELPLFPDASPRKEDLDRVVPDRPACLYAADHHSAWLNSRALAVAGITRDTRDPPDGRIERDETGEPSGTLREGAMALVARHLPPLSHDEHVRGLRRALELAARFGITSLQDADADDAVLAAYHELDRRGELSARVVAALHVDPSRGAEQIAELIATRDRETGRRLRATAAKLFVDGVIESQTAALLEPYLGRPDHRGMPSFEPKALAALVTGLDGAGFQVHVHAIGDAAVRMSLDAFEAAQRANGRRDLRHQIAHLELIDPADVPRFRRLGVIANFQPLWAYADSYVTELTEPVLGPQRSRWLYPIGSVARSGAVVVGGSDWSVTSMNPFDAIQVALTRRALEAAAGPPWLPEQTLDLATALAAYTINGAYANHQERTTGSIEVGKLADLVVLDRNLFEIAAEEIHRTEVLFTFVEGEEVYRAPGATIRSPGP